MEQCWREPNRFGRDERRPEKSWGACRRGAKGVESRGAIGSKVTSSAQSRHETGRTGGSESVATDVCMLILTREGGDVWVEDDTVVVMQGTSDWTPTEDVGGDLSWVQPIFLMSCPTVSHNHFSFAAPKMRASSKAAVRAV